MIAGNWKIYGRATKPPGKFGDALDPQQKAIADEFDEYESSYEDAVNDALSFSGLKIDFFTKVKADYLLDILRKHTPSADKATVLDVGCGVGVYHDLLAPALGSLHGVDVSKACIDRAIVAHPNVTYTAYDGERLPYEDASFDAVFTICVMHHVPPAKWEQFSSEFARILRPGGIGVVFEHNPRNPLTMKVVNQCPFDEDAVLLKAPKTVELMSGAGLENVKTNFILNIPAMNGPLRKIDTLFTPIALGAQYFVSGYKSQAV